MPLVVMMLLVLMRVLLNLFELTSFLLGLSLSLFLLALGNLLFSEFDLLVLLAFLIGGGR